jgi:probable HAF family extracellular repeat protein
VSAEGQDLSAGLDIPECHDPEEDTRLDALVFGINNAGQIVGAYIGSSTINGFLLDQGNYTTLDVPGASYTSAQGINASGQIVGYYWDAGGTSHGFLATPVP